MAEADIAVKFEETVNYVKSSEADFEPGRTLKLKIYALYKQATEGDVSGKKPGLLDPVGRSKYKAWAELSGTSSADAMQKYINEINMYRKDT